MRYELQVLRGQVVDEARSWVGTPYHKAAMVKGAGVDCATLLIAVYRKFDLMANEKTSEVAEDWWRHATENQYAVRMLRYANRIAQTICRGGPMQFEAGNAVLACVAGAGLYNHGAIITRWPRAVEAVQPRVREIDVTRDPLWMGRSITVFDPFNRSLEPQ